MSINRIPWTRERIAAYKAYLNGDHDREFRGKKKDGTPYTRGVPVRTLIERQKSITYSVSGSQLMADDGKNGKRAVLSPEAVATMVKSLYKNKAIAVGKAPSIYQYMKTKFCGFGYARIEAAMKTMPEYQKYQARHLQKKKSRTVIISRAPGAEIDADLMFFSKKYYYKGMNDNNQGLLVVVDRFSGYLAVSPVAFGAGGKSAAVVSRKCETILRTDSFPKVRGRTIFTDAGAEFSEMFQQRMAQLGYNHVVISQAAGAPSPHAERAVGIIRKLINQKLSAAAKPKAETQRWWPLARTLVRSYNDTPMTDSRAPNTPNQLKRLRGAKAAAMVRGMQKAGAKRLGLKKNARKVGNDHVQKSLPVLNPGDRVRAAIEILSKTGAMERKYPKQRWSSRVYVVVKRLGRKLGFARYTLRGLPRRRFEREDLQLVGRGQKKDAEGPSEEESDTEEAVAKRGSKLTSRRARDG